MKTGGVPERAPVLHCLRAFRQIAGSAGSREVDEGIGTAAAKWKDMIGLELLVRTAIDAGISIALHDDAADDVPVG
jgi:hypothetical protein